MVVADLWARPICCVAVAVATELLATFCCALVSKKADCVLWSCSLLVSAKFLVKALLFMLVFEGITFTGVADMNWFVLAVCSIDLLIRSSACGRFHIAL